MRQPRFQDRIDVCSCVEPIQECRHFSVEAWRQGLQAIAIYFVLNNVLVSLPSNAESLANAVGLGFINKTNGDWPGLAEEARRLQFLLYGLILVGMMLLRPQGLFPSRVREQELKHDAVVEEETVAEQVPAR